MPQNYVYKAKKGLSEKIVEEISFLKNEPKWMRDFRLKSYQIFIKKPLPTWGADLSQINFDDIYYYIKPTDKQAKSWDDLPKEIKETYDRIGVPEAEKKFLAGVSAQYESEVVYESINRYLQSKGVIFCDMDTAVRKYPEIVRQYFGQLIPPYDNKFAALNSAVWSGGSFVYVPKNVSVSMPLQAYFRINAQNFGQFERTLIIAEEGSFVHYTEGCTAPIYTTDSLHAAVVEIFVKKGARVRYTTVQNWSHNVYNLVTKRARTDEEAIMEWIDCNIGCLPKGSKIFTEKGIKDITEITDGDKVLSYDFSNKKYDFFLVKGKINQGKKTVYELTTENFRQIEATDNHPFFVLRKNPTNGKYYLCGWLPLADIKKNDYIALQNFSIPYRQLKPCPQPRRKFRSLKNEIKLPKYFDDDFMWFLGIYLGDGYLEYDKKGKPRRLYLAIPERDRARNQLISFIKNKLKSKYSEKGTCVTINSALLTDIIDQLGFGRRAKNKKIPQWLWTLPLSQRLAFIRGYLESDGYFRKNKKGELTQIILASSNKALLEEIKLLMISCGLNPTKISSYIKLRTLYKNKQKIYRSYYLHLSYKENKIMFDLGLKKTPVDFQILVFSKVIDIKKIAKKTVYDIEIDQVKNFFANGILVHNSKVTMKYPSVYLFGKKSKGEVLSIAYANKNQHQDAGAKMIHFDKETKSRIISKSISKSGGRTSYRGLIQIMPEASLSSSYVSCDALILDEFSRSDTYPDMRIKNNQVSIQHEATVEKIGEEKLFYLMSRGIKKSEAESLFVNGFIEPVAKEIPLEYAIELNRLINLEMSGSVG